MGGGCMSGAGGRSRTLDLRITNALLYRLSYTGVGMRFFADAWGKSNSPKPAANYIRQPYLPPVVVSRPNQRDAA